MLSQRYSRVVVSYLDCRQPSQLRAPSTQTKTLFRIGYGYTRYLYEFYSILFSSILFLFCVVFVTVLVLVTVAVIRIVTVFVIILVMTSVLPILVLVILILNAIPILLIQVLVLSFKSYCILILFNSVLCCSNSNSNFF